MSLAIAAGFGLGGAGTYPGVFGDFGGFADDARIENGVISLSDRPGIGFEGQPRCTASCASWRQFDRYSLSTVGFGPFAAAARRLAPDP